jgi:glycosyltransferase involved in cell wall biosynthesis
MTRRPVVGPGTDAAVSVVLCTHEPRADYLARALDGLRAQRLDVAQWELILVDNASSARLEDRWDLSWHPRARFVREEELGLTAARLAGIRASSGALLVFVDDDNLLARDFLERAIAVAAAHPHLGVLGAGALVPEFEVEPPAALRHRLGMLALRSVPRPVWTNDPENTDVMPWGAGMVVTRAVAQAYLEVVAEESVRAVVGRRGSRLFSGEDNLFSWAASALGLGFGLFPDLRVTHLISARRVTKRHFLRLCRDQRFSHAILMRLLARESGPRGLRDRLTRLLTRAVLRGWFELRCELAGQRGEGAAARFLAEHDLRPVALSARDASSDDVSERTRRERAR